MRALARRVTPSMIIAIIALGVALGGSSVAANVTQAIRGTQVAKNSLPGNRVQRGTLPADRLRPGSVTGRQVNEGRLGKVPRARIADTATTAANATALGAKPAAAYRTFSGQVIPSGTTVTGAFGFSANVSGGTATELKEVVSLPGLAGNDLTDEAVNFGNAVAVGDPDPACAGRALAPTAPAGRVCIYLSASVGVGTVVTGEAIPLLSGSRAGFVVHAIKADAATGVFGTWAYTAP